MSTSPSPRSFMLQSISFKNILLFLLILSVALIPLALRYYQDSRDYEIQILASKLEFFAERGASWLDVTALSQLTQPAHMNTPAYHTLVDSLNRIERDFNVDNAIVMRRGPNGQYTYLASGTTSSEAATSTPEQTAQPDTTRNPCNPAQVATPTIQNPCHPAAVQRPVVSNPCNPALANQPAVQNPCNPALLAKPVVQNPCNPALLSRTDIQNPCNPTLVTRSTVQNPCNPAVLDGGSVQNPCNPDMVRNPCAPSSNTAGGFALGQPVHIHQWFPRTYKATETTWQRGEMMHSELFGGEVDGQQFDQFLQINTPLKLDNDVVAILMLNKFANPVAAAVQANTLQVVGLTAGILAVGLALFGYSSARMLQPLKNLTTAANEVAQGNLDVTLPTRRSRDEVGRLANSFDTMIDGLRQRDFIRDTFGRYLSKEVVEEVLDSPDGLKLGGETRKVTFLVSDLRGFTSLSARLPAHVVIDILNRYLERMVDIIASYRGTVDEFQGDGILAFFGAPLATEDDQERAVACAISMQAALLEINAEQRRLGLPELNMGIGINTGEAIVGNIGSERRTKYGAVGSAINEAYRIESYTIGGQILISPSVYEPVSELADIASTQEVQFKGLEHPITLYNVVGLRGPYATSLPDKTPETFIALNPALTMSCFPVEGKTIASTPIAGTITQLAETTAHATLNGDVALHSNLLIHLTPPDAPVLPDVYAKVMASRSTDNALTEIQLGFTSLPEPAKLFLEQQRAAAT